jgi:6-phosphogluconolactonase
MTDEGDTHASLYVATGRTLSHYAVDAGSCALDKLGEVQLPNDIQFGWPHPDLPVLYLSCGVAPGVNADGSWACAVHLDPDTGAPSMPVPATALPGRALHLTTDRSGQHLLLAHTRPAGLSVRRLAADGRIAEAVDQRPGIEVGVFPHQVRVTPDGRWCICVARGIPSAHAWKASKEPQTEPGSLHVFAYEDGRLGESNTVVLGDGRRFGPRNLDFDGPWIALVLETQNEMLVFRRDRDGRVDPEPLQRVSTLADPDAEIHQGAGPVLVHPQRGVVYMANRAYRPRAVTAQEKIIPAAAENSIVVYKMDPDTGWLQEIQRIHSGGACPRTLSLDPTGRVLVVANSETYRIDHGDHVEQVTMNLSTFQVLDDGRLIARHRYETGNGADIAWSGTANHPRTDRRTMERTT